MEQENDASEPRSLQLNQNHCRQLRLKDVAQHLQMGEPAQPAEPRAPDGRDEQQDLRSKRQKTAQASDAPVDVPVPMQDDDDLMVEDVTFVDGAEPDLPVG